MGKQGFKHPGFGETFSGNRINDAGGYLRCAQGMMIRRIHHVYVLPKALEDPSQHRTGNSLANNQYFFQKILFVTTTDQFNKVFGSIDSFFIQPAVANHAIFEQVNFSVFKLTKTVQSVNGCFKRLSIAGE